MSAKNVKPAVLDARWRTRANLSGMLVGPDGSLVVADRIADRYRRPGMHEGGESLESDTRTETERDRGRLSYSTQLRRLAGVTQVVSPDLQTAQLHSRASHTHKVALIAREVAEHLARRALTDKALQKIVKQHGGLDIAACEAAGLAHDLGHPPFGHVGEEILELELRGTPGVWEGFEGNAQSFRIVTTLAHQKADGEAPGLALTNVTLAAILKYPYHRDVRPRGSDEHGEGHQKFGAYRSETDLLTTVRDAVIPGNDDAAYMDEVDAPKPGQTLEASIMDLADDIAYSVHDLEDFCSRGTIDLRLVDKELERALDSLSSSGSTDEANVFVEAADDLRKKHSSFFTDTAYRDALTSVRRTFDFIERSRTSSTGTFAGTLREQLSIIVSEFFEAIRCDDSTDKPPVYLDTAAWHKMQVLKRVTKQYLVNTPAVGQIQRAQIIAMRRLFRGTVNWIQEATSASALPVKLQEMLAGNNLGVPDAKKGEQLTEDHYRAVADYICTMSDSEAFEVSQWLAGAHVPGTAAGD